MYTFNFTGSGKGAAREAGSREPVDNLLLLALRLGGHCTCMHRAPYCVLCRICVCIAFFYLVIIGVDCAVSSAIQSPSSVSSHSGAMQPLKCSQHVRELAGVSSSSSDSEMQGALQFAVSAEEKAALLQVSLIRTAAGITAAGSICRCYMPTPYACTSLCFT
jgi:hypothetical protein